MSLRPNTVMIERQILGPVTQTGSRAVTIVSLNTSVGALIDLMPRGDVLWLVEGQTYHQDATLFIDGLYPYQFVGTSAGGSTSVGGVGYTVEPNGLAAFPPIAPNDRVTDESGEKYLVLGVMKYYTYNVTLEAHLSRGRNW
jgi:hypothetical protein